MEKTVTTGKGAGLTEDQPVLSLGNLSLNLWNYRATVAAMPIDLTYQEFELLRILALQPDRILAFDALAQELWQAGGHREVRRLNVLAFRLRAKLVDSYPYRIETVRGRGYGLVAAGPERPSSHGS